MALNLVAARSATGRGFAHLSRPKARAATKWRPEIPRTGPISFIAGSPSACESFAMTKEIRKMDGTRPPGFAEAPAASRAADGGVHSANSTLLAEGHRFRVQYLRLAPGEATSLQSHLHRSEHWVVVEGTAEITVGVLSRLVVEGEAAHIPLGKPHRLDNPGRLPAVLIAVETGSYLADDDVIRYD